jgi:S1-C subfamily serine protease
VPSIAVIVRVIASHQPGDKLSVTYRSGTGQSTTVTVTLGTAKS